MGTFGPHNEGKSYNKWNNEAIIKAIASTRGNVSKAARNLGYNQAYLRRKVNEDPELKEAIEEIREANLDQAEDKLWEHIMERNSLQALMEYLRGVGKRRGYGSQSIDMALQAKVDHGLDDETLAALVEKFREQLDD